MAGAVVNDQNRMDRLNAMAAGGTAGVQAHDAAMSAQNDIGQRALDTTLQNSGYGLTADQSAGLQGIIAHGQAPSIEAATSGVAQANDQQGFNSDAITAYLANNQHQLDSRALGAQDHMQTAALAGTLSAQSNAQQMADQQQKGDTSLWARQQEINAVNQRHQEQIEAVAANRAANVRSGKMTPEEKAYIEGKGAAAQQSAGAWDSFYNSASTANGYTPGSANSKPDALPDGGAFDPDRISAPVRTGAIGAMLDAHDAEVKAKGAPSVRDPMGYNQRAAVDAGVDPYQAMGMFPMDKSKNALRLEGEEKAQNYEMYGDSGGLHAKMRKDAEDNKILRDDQDRQRAQNLNFGEDVTGYRKALNAIGGKPSDLGDWLNSQKAKDLEELVRFAGTNRRQADGSAYPSAGWSSTADMLAYMKQANNPDGSPKYSIGDQNIAAERFKTITKLPQQ